MVLGVEYMYSGNRGFGGCWHGPKSDQPAQCNMATQVTETGSSNKQSITVTATAQPRLRPIECVSTTFEKRKLQMQLTPH